MRHDFQAALDRSEAYQHLAKDRRRQLAGGLTRIQRFLDAPELEAQVRDHPELGALLGAVAFPDFVAGLIRGVFESIVNASVEQMKAYADLVEEVTKSLDEYAAETAQTGDRDHLARGRQQVLATMVLMGINRIIVTNGRINTKVHFKIKSEDEDEDEDERK